VILIFNLVIFIFMLQITIAGGERCVFGLYAGPSGNPSIVPPSARCPNTYSAWHNIFSRSGEIWMKIGTDIRHVSGHCWKVLKGQYQ